MQTRNLDACLPPNLSVCESVSLSFLQESLQNLLHQTVLLQLAVAVS